MLAVQMIPVLSLLATGAVDEETGLTAQQLLTALMGMFRKPATRDTGEALLVDTLQSIGARQPQGTVHSVVRHLQSAFNIICYNIILYHYILSAYI